MTEALVRRIDQDGVAVVELNRPERKNALIGPLMQELAAVVQSVNADESVQAVVLCGAGGAFCSGLDLDAYNADPPPDWLGEAGNWLRDAHVALATCPVPVVVALERYAINGGAAFALAGDLIIVGETGWLQVGEVRLGMPAPNNLAWLLARYSLSTTLQIVIPGERIHGPRLHELGVAHEVVADDQVRARAEELAAQLASFPAGAGRTIKGAALRIAGADDAEAWFARARELGTTTETARVKPGRMG